MIISFTIDGTSYQAEERMTWAEWVASSYNTDGFYVGPSELYGEDTVHFSEYDTWSVGFQDYPVSPSDAISSGEYYGHTKA